MRVNEIPQQRLHNQRITQSAHRHATDVVAWLGAVQAQEFGPAKWALGLRSPVTTTEAAIDRAFDAGRILRTHVMRPTWHFVARSDIRWMLELTAPHVHRTISHYCRRLGLDGPIQGRATTVFERALDGQPLTRRELGVHLGRAGIPTTAVQLAMLTIYAELEGVICSGPRRGKEMTYAQLVSRAPRAGPLPRDEALGRLTARFFSSHGPATIRDFVWWSGLKTSDAKRGLDMNRARSAAVDGTTYWTIGEAPRRRSIEAAVHLLPIYDEYLVSYRDRHAVPHGPTVVRSRSRGPVTFQHALVIAGQVAGTWRMTRTGDAVCLDVIPLRKLGYIERERLGQAAARYGRFLDVPVSLSVSP
jgi:hypothetical protein